MFMQGLYSLIIGNGAFLIHQARKQYNYLYP